MHRLPPPRRLPAGPRLERTPPADSGVDIHIARVFMGRKKNFVGQHFWARGYYVTTVGHDTEVVRQYIKKQEDEDKRLDQMRLW